MAEVWPRIQDINISKNLNIHKSTVARILALFHRTGSVAKKVYPKDAAFRKITSVCGLLIVNLVVSKPGIYLHEIQAELKDALQIDVNLSTIGRFLFANKFTRQKLRHVALQRDAFAREQYILDVSLYSPEMLVFVDETSWCRSQKHTAQI